MGILRAAARLSAIALAVQSGARGARAEPSPSTELSWSGPDSCPSEAEVRAEVERYLGQTLAARRDQKIRIDGSVREDGTSGFTLSLRVTSARGVQKRELSNTDCKKLGEAGALVIALAIDPKLVVPPPASPPPSDPNPPPPTGEPGAAEPVTAPPAIPTAPEPPPPVVVAIPAPERDDGPPSAPAVRAPSSWRVSAAGVGLASGGPLPGVALGVGARVAAAMGRFQIVVHGAYLFPKTEPVPMSSTAQIELDLFRAGVGFCGVPLVGSLSLTGCLGPVFGDLRGTGKDLENHRTEHDRWSAVIADITLSHVWNGGLLGVIGIEGGPTIEAPRFGVSVDGEEVEVYRASGWVVSGYLGVGMSQ